MCRTSCCCVHYIEIYTEQRAFVDRINLLFSFEEHWCWIIPITSRSLRWICSIVRYVWTMVSAFQKWWLRGCRQGTWRIAKKRITSEGAYSEWSTVYQSSEFNVFLLEKNSNVILVHLIFNSVVINVISKCYQYILKAYIDRFVTSTRCESQIVSLVLSIF